MLKRIGVALMTMLALAVSPAAFARHGLLCDQVKQLVGRPDLLKASFTENQIHACTGGMVIWVSPYVRQADALVPGHWKFQSGSSPVKPPVPGS
uniref:Uncharacterized protein n=1 Tax=Burkholderia sp. M701 TaxID=326454 RepID=V5YNL6_9BURK|nr:hypothetical protein [Burkholderia sp. M701]BAO19185.1 hypothetical protein [Burkholderia sp. M701]